MSVRSGPLIQTANVGGLANTKLPGLSHNGRPQQTNLVPVLPYLTY
jgi:hypothetical protein